MTYNETTSSSYTGNSSTLTAFFEDRDDAATAVQRLTEAGVDAASIRLVEGNDTATTGRSDDSKGFWASLEDFFFPDDDRAVYSEGLRRGGYLVTVTGLDASHYDQALDILDDEGSIDLDERAETWKTEGWKPEGYSDTVSDAADTITSTTTAAAARSATLTDNVRSDGDQVIPVMAEELKIGKRDVNAGRVKVRAYTVETPVSEQISLRNESVVVERRPVDRAVDAADVAFQDRTIEAEEHREEAIISKEARVVEEISLRKTADVREETVTDSVRKTEVEIDDKRVTDSVRKTEFDDKRVTDTKRPV